MGHVVTKEEAEYQVRAAEIKQNFTKAVGINILLVGPKRSGKSALVNQFLNNRYSNLYQATSRTSLCNFNLINTL